MHLECRAESPLIRSTQVLLRELSLTRGVYVDCYKLVTELLSYTPHVVRLFDPRMPLPKDVLFVRDEPDPKP
jgi:hypothetical protein